MTFTYNGTLTTTLDKVRFRIGDTDSGKALLTDEEINPLIARYTGDVLTAIHAVKGILAKIARDIDRSAVGYSSSRSQKTQHYRDLLRDLQDELAMESEAYAGGLSVDEQETDRDNDDLRQPRFRVGMHSNNGVDDNDPTRSDL